MGSKRKLQTIFLNIKEGRLDHIPPSCYRVAIQKTWIEGGNIKFEGAVIQKEEEGERMKDEDSAHAYLKLAKVAGERPYKLSAERASWHKHKIYYIAYIDLPDTGVYGGLLEDCYTPMEAADACLANHGRELKRQKELEENNETGTK